MTDWHARVTTHLRQRALDLPDEVVEELTTHLEDAWEAEHGPAGDAVGIDAFVARGLQRANLGARARTRPARPAPRSAPEPGGASLVSGLASELRHTLRLRRRAPGFRLAIVTVMAPGIAATTAAFGLVYSTLLAPLPYPDADRLVLVWEHDLTRHRPRNVINPGNFFAWSERSTSIASAGMFSPTVGNLAGTGGAPDAVPGMVVHTNVLGLVGARPVARAAVRGG